MSPTRFALVAISLFASFAVCLAPQSAEAKPSSKQTSICSLDAKGFQRRLNSTENRLAFANPPGPLKTGLCWWHTRFQRNANYLFEGSATSAMTSDARTVSEAIKAIIGQSRIVKVPGYANLYQFSAAYSTAITEALAQWQITDSAFRFGWARGLKGSAKGNALQMQKEVLDAYKKVKQGQIVYQMLQVPGVVAHAWLVYGAAQESGTAAGPYRLDVVDSNAPTSTMNFSYTLGMPNFYGYLGQFSPITERESELKKSMKRVVDDCAARGENSPLRLQMKTIFGG